MKPIAFLMIIAAVAGCSEQANCISGATRDLSVLERLTAETRANVQRGYAIAKQEEPYTVQERCSIPQPDGSVLVQLCPEIRTRTRNVPVSINLDEERAKLSGQEQRLAGLRSESAARVAQCKAQYPE